MPRFFFHFVRPALTIRDQEGRELPDRQAAIEELSMIVGELADRPPDGDDEDWSGLVIEVHDEHGNFVASAVVATAK